MKVWLVGAGYMAQEYAKVLDNLNVVYEVIGNGEESAKKFEKVINKKVSLGGLEKKIKNSKPPEQAIVAVGVDSLKIVALELIKSGVKRILLEKPGGLNKAEISEINNLSKVFGAKVLIAYNRRFFKSTETLKKLIEKDGGATSCIFEFTEWSYKIALTDKAKNIKETWFLANSSHVVDLAFHICGYPIDFNVWQKGSLSWHPAAERFCGAGITENGVLFSYHADWSAPGRWGVEVLTKKNRYILRPLEDLQVIRIGSLDVEKIEIDDSLDVQFKPGLFNQTQNFLNCEDKILCSIEDQLLNVDVFNKIAGYEPCD